LAFLSRAYSKEKVIIAVAVEAYNFFVCYLIVIVVKEKLREMNFTSVVFGSSIHFSFHWNSKLHRTIIERHGTTPGNNQGHSNIFALAIQNSHHRRCPRDAPPIRDRPVATTNTSHPRSHVSKAIHGMNMRSSQVAPIDQVPYATKRPIYCTPPGKSAFKLLPGELHEEGPEDSRNSSCCDGLQPSSAVALTTHALP
jgi:hypothetical protein